MISTAEIRALMMTLDPMLVTAFTNISRELGIDAQKSANTRAVPDELGRTKYDALLIDFDSVSETLPILASVRANPSNKDALVFAVATGSAHRQQALAQGATFIFERPFATADIRRALCSSYDKMLRGRRRYFRYAVEIPVLLTPRSSGTEIRCTTINISSSGMAVTTPCSMNPGEIVEIALLSPDSGLALQASGTVVWDDKHGKAGLCFHAEHSELQTQLNSWLDSRFYERRQPRPPQIVR